MEEFLIDLFEKTPAFQWLQANPLAIYILIIIATLLATGFFVCKHYEKKQQKIEDQYKTAIALLESGEEIQKLRGLRELKELMKTSHEMHQRVLDSFIDYLHLHHPAIYEEGRVMTPRKLANEKFTSFECKYNRPGKDKHDYAVYVDNLVYSPPPRIVQEIISIISSRKHELDKPNYVMNLSGLNLSSISFEKGCFDNADFGGSILQRADFSECSLVSSSFQAAIIHKALFMKAELSKASVAMCSAHHTNFDEASLLGTDFSFSDLYSSYIQKAKANKACFFNAAMWRCSGGLTNFQDADFRGTNLESVDFHASLNVTPDQVKFASTSGARLPWMNSPESSTSLI